MINALLSPWALFNALEVLRPLNLERLKVLATRATKGLDCYGDPSYEPFYRETMRMVNESNYSPIGKAAAHDFFLRRLMSKLRLNDHLSDPGVSKCLKSPVVKPLFVVGLPRTGTSLLHRLLALDPNSRAPKCYELFDPVPRYPNDPARDRSSRVSFVQRAIDKLKMVVPHFTRIHEVGADLPEECMMSLGCDIPMLFATFHILIRPPHDAFDWDATQAYKNYVRVLQLLQHQASEAKDEELMNKTWTLKCPVHLGLLKYLSRGFPDATIVWTHREAREAVGSLCSFIRATQDMYEGEFIKLDKLGEDVLNFAKEWIKRADEFFSSKESKGHPTANVHYDDLVKDPVGTVRNLYKDLGRSFTDEYEQRLLTYVAENKKQREALKKSGQSKLHSYNIEDFDIKQEEVDQALQWYVKKYSKA